jgi:hypothetical protein
VNSGSTPASERSRRRAWLAIGLLVVALLAAIGIRHALQPRNATRLILDQAGRALGLQLTASGEAQYSVGGMPTLVIHDVVAREPGAMRPLLRADRISLSLPWSTIRGLRDAGRPIALERVELDRPVLDLDALQRWLQHRPPGKARYPTLAKGLHVSDGSLVATGWTLEGLALDVPLVAPGQRLTGHASGRYRSGSLRVPFDLAFVLANAAKDTAMGIAGDLGVEHGAWKVPAQFVLSGVSHVQDGWRLEHTRLAVAARYASGRTSQPFTAGIAGTLRYAGARLTASPLGVAIHGDGMVPSLAGHGDASLSTTLDLRLSGALPAWPATWPALPPPLGDSKSPLAFDLAYAGKTDLSDRLALRLQRDAVVFDGTLRVPEVATWIAASDLGTPLPPLRGHLTAPRLDIAGARLEGVDITIRDNDANAATRAP